MSNLEIFFSRVSLVRLRYWLAIATWILVARSLHGEPSGRDPLIAAAVLLGGLFLEFFRGPGRADGEDGGSRTVRRAVGVFAGSVLWILLGAGATALELWLHYATSRGPGDLWTALMAHWLCSGMVACSIDSPRAPE